MTELVLGGPRRSEAVIGEPSASVDGCFVVVFFHHGGHGGTQRTAGVECVGLRNTKDTK